MSTDAEGQQTGEHPLLPGTVGYNRTVAQLWRGEITYHQFLEKMSAAKPDLRERVRVFFETIANGFGGMVTRHRKR